ncbi:hypothetical protein L3Y34_017280 [Caenorhabditis briggsae]|uniref:Uncharacterized protein n=1 Tax=Caenorhabditis briggsae TaxID=6238 RepID=A0AAE9DHW0_CAEBR|nr:hypothetical protein L3Y34_017280 [Caenorhabditis briggsae]
MKSLVKNMNIHVESIYIHWAWHPEIKIIRVAKGDSCFLTIIRRRSTRYNNILVSWQLMFNAFFDFETLNGLESCLQFWDHATYIFKPKKIIVEFHNDQLASEQIRKYLAISLQKEYHQISIRRGTVDSEYLDYLMENVNLNSKLLIGFFDNFTIFCNHLNNCFLE